jgi:hypothetical protein
VCPRDLGSWDHENENNAGTAGIEKMTLKSENLVIPDLIPNASSLGSWDHIREQDPPEIPARFRKMNDNKLKK